MSVGDTRIETSGSTPDPLATATKSKAMRIGMWSIVVVWTTGLLVMESTNVVTSFQYLGLLDTQVYRMGGQAILNGSPLYEAAYSWDSLAFTYSPFAAIVFVPFALAGWTGGAILMTVASVAATLRVCQLVVRQLSIDRASLLRPLGVFLVCIALGLWPIRSTLEYGQINLIIMWLVVEDLLGTTAKRRWSGVLIGVAIGIKLTPFVFLGLLFFSRQHRKLAIACATAAGTVVLGFLIQPHQAWTYWTNKLFDTSRIGESAYVSNQSLAGVISRVAGHPITAVWAAGAVAIFVGTGMLAGKLWRQNRPVEAITAVAIGGLLISPISWVHHWTWLLLAAAVVAVPSREESKAARITRLALLATIVIGGSVTTLMFVSPGAIPWRNPSLIDWALGNSMTLLGVAVLAFLFTKARQPDKVGSVQPETLVTS